MSLSFKIQKSMTSHGQHQNSKLNKYEKTQSRGFDSSDEDGEDQDVKGHGKRAMEFITDFDSTRRPSDPDDSRNMFIPALPDRDFRAIHMARKQKRAKKELFRPDQVNSMGGALKDTPNLIKNLEGVDQVNSKQVEGGLKTSTNVKITQVEELQVENPVPITTSTDQGPRTIEERAVKELLSQANKSTTEGPDFSVQVIQMPSEANVDDDSSDSGNETTQFRRDVSKRPDSSTLDDYDRIPVGQFGLALLKGMGWKEGTAATKKGRVGLVQAYVPQPRPSLLGIGAKPLATLENDLNIKSMNPVKPNKKYVPLLRKVIDNGGKAKQDLRSPSSNQDSVTSSSRDQSRSSSPNSSRGKGKDYEDSKKYETSRQRDSHARRDERGRRDYTNHEVPSQDRYGEDRSRYRDSRQKDSSYQRDVDPERDDRSRRDISDSDRPSYSHRHHSRSSSHRHLSSSSSSHGNHYHQSSRDESHYK